MSGSARQITFQSTLLISGEASDADATPAITVVRVSDGATVAGPTLSGVTHPSTGTYAYTFSPALTGETYSATWTYALDGDVIEAGVAAVTVPASSDESYLPDLDEADDLAAGTPGLGSFKAASDAARTNALTAASSRIDNAMRYQGQKYAPAVTGAAQALEFPRIARSGGSLPSVVGNAFPAASLASEVYDWDSTNNTAIVPRNVKLATLHEANSILDGQRAAMLDAQHNGLASQSIGSASESYRAPVNPASGIPVLCFDANTLMQRYRLRSGQMV